MILTFFNIINLDLIEICCTFVYRKLDNINIKQTDMSSTCILKPVNHDGSYLLQDKTGRTFNCLREQDDVEEFLRTNARRNNAIRVAEKDGKLVYRACHMDFYNTATGVDEDFELMLKTATNFIETETVSDERRVIMEFLNTTNDLKPDRLKMHSIKWKYLVRSVLRGKNIMMTGPTGCGKTLAVQSLSMAFQNQKSNVINQQMTKQEILTMMSTYSNNGAAINILSVA
jgi:hypothetical protein